jgi:hypothetical protein
LVEDRPVALTEKEYGIIELLSLRKGAILTKEMFLDHLYGGTDEPELKIIDVFVCKLRKKIAEATGGLHYIETVWGRGYVLRDPAAPWAAGASTLNENLAERIRAVLAGTGSVREVRMFGGLCFMLNGNMVAGAFLRVRLLRLCPPRPQSRRLCRQRVDEGDGEIVNPATTEHAMSVDPQIQALLDRGHRGARHTYAAARVARTQYEARIALMAPAADVASVREQTIVVPGGRVAPEPVAYRCSANHEVVRRCLL